MIQKLAIAAVVVAVLAVQAAFFHVVVAAPLASAVGEMRVSARAPMFEESILVVGARPVKHI